MSLKFNKTFNKSCVSLGCNPIEGSSKMYKEPVKLEPKEVANFIR